MQRCSNKISVVDGVDTDPFAPLGRDAAYGHEPRRLPLIIALPFIGGVSAALWAGIGGMLGLIRFW